MNVAFISPLLTMIVFLKIFGTDGACTLPALVDGTWWDSRVNTDITFDQSTGQVSSGWSITAYGSTMNRFTCVESDSSYWLFQSDVTVLIFGVDYYGFLCVKKTLITDYSYYYYLDSNLEADAGNIRISVEDKSKVDNGLVTISETCSPTSGPGAEEFHVLVKANQQATLQQYFPEALLGVYAYNVTDSSSTSHCGAGSVWDVCSNRTTMSFNYTQCTRQMFGSTSGTLYATKYVTSGSTTYAIVVNGDASPSTKFTCLAVSGTSVSSNPGSCIKGQSATSRTSDSNSVLIRLSAYETCPFTTATDSGGSNAGIIAGVVVVLILIIGGVGGFIFYHKYTKKPFPWQKTQVQNMKDAENAEKPPPEFSGLAVEPVSPRVAVDVDVPAGKNRSLPPINKPTPKIDVSRNQPLPSITRQ